LFPPRHVLDGGVVEFALHGTLENELKRSLDIFGFYHDSVIILVGQVADSSGIKTLVSFD